MDYAVNATAAPMTLGCPPILLRERRLFIDEMGHRYPVTQWLDAAGEEIDDPESAVVAIAGAGGCWFTLDLSHFPEETTQ